MAYLMPDSVESSPTTELSWTQLIPDKERVSRVRITDPKDLKEVPAEEVPMTDANGKPRVKERRSSLLGNFQKHLRMSLKAVSDSPGQLSR